MGNQAGDFLKVLLAGVEIADDDLQLRQAVPRRRQPPARIFGQPAEAGDQSWTVSRSPSLRSDMPSRGRTAGCRSWRRLRSTTAS